jgi:hypothetical protein
MPKQALAPRGRAPAASRSSRQTSRYDVCKEVGGIFERSLVCIPTASKKVMLWPGIFSEPAPYNPVAGFYRWIVVRSAFAGMEVDVSRLDGL